MRTQSRFGGFIPGTATTTANVYGSGGFATGQATTTYTPATPIIVRKPRGGIVIKMVSDNDPQAASAYDASLIYNQLMPQLAS